MRGPLVVIINIKFRFVYSSLQPFGLVVYPGSFYDGFYTCIFVGRIKCLAVALYLIKSRTAILKPEAVFSSYEAFVDQVD